jgi:hypothetical protein
MPSSGESFNVSLLTIFSLALRSNALPFAGTCPLCSTLPSPKRTPSPQQRQAAACNTTAKSRTPDSELLVPPQAQTTVRPSSPTKSIHPFLQGRLHQFNQMTSLNPQPAPSARQPLLPRRPPPRTRRNKQYCRIQNLVCTFSPTSFPGFLAPTHALAIRVTDRYLQYLARITITRSNRQTINIMLYLNKNTLSE